MTSDELDAVASNALLAFPIRHHYECHADCKLCLDDHMRLADFLYEVGGIPRSIVDALGDYRRWLDRHKIYAEGADGWGTRNAFDAENIKAYLREEWDCAAFDDANKMLHPTQKPEKLLEELIEKYSDSDETVLDCFMGSGSTGVACINTNRSFIGIEKEAKYFDIACRRIEDAQRQWAGCMSSNESMRGGRRR